MPSPRVRLTSAVAALPMPAGRLARLASAALRRITRLRPGEVADGLRRGLPRRPVVVSLVVLGDPAIRRLNRRFLGHDYATDVLSFNLQPGTLFGEIYVSATTAAREAKARGIDPAEELLRYAIHGMLHLFGHDDHRPADRRRMWSRQEALLRVLQGTETQSSRRMHGGGRALT